MILIQKLVDKYICQYTDYLFKYFAGRDNTFRIIKL